MNTAQRPQINHIPVGYPTADQLSELLSKSIAFEQMKKHLCNMLNEWEAQFDLETEFSYESKIEYIEAARFMKAHGRKYDRIEFVERSIEENN